MKLIKGENYYISLGYMDEENIKETGIDASKIESVMVTSKKKPGTEYINDTDIKNIINIPIFPVDYIQKANKTFKFRYLFRPDEAKWLNKKPGIDYKINVIGLFAVKRVDNKEYIRNVGFFYNDQPHYIFDSKLISIEIEENDLAGGVKDGE